VAIDDFQNKETAYKVIEDAIKMYKEHFPNNGK
jgi:inorganic pyrophosphatase